MSAYTPGPLDSATDRRGGAEADGDQQRKKLEEEALWDSIGT